MSPSSYCENKTASCHPATSCQETYDSYKMVRERVVLSNHLRPEWTSEESVTLRLHNLPKWATPLIIYKNFAPYGTIDLIEIDDDPLKLKHARARIRYKPPPSEVFWRSRRFQISDISHVPVELTLNIESSPKMNIISSWRKPSIHYPEILTLSFHELHFGRTYDDITLLSLRSLGQGLLHVDVSRRRIELYFKVDMQTRGSNSRTFYDYRYIIQFDQIAKLCLAGEVGCDMSVLLPLNTPPLCHRRILNPRATFSKASKRWDSRDTWFRQTNIPYHYCEPSSLPVAINEPYAFIDIGRWTTLAFLWKPANLSEDFKLSQLMAVMLDMDIPVQVKRQHGFVERPSNVWLSHYDTTAKSGESLSSPSHELRRDFYLTFSRRYHLEVCLSYGFLCEHTLSKKFFRTLAGLPEADNQMLLENVASKRLRLCDPVDSFYIQPFRHRNRGDIPHHCCIMRTARITPTAIYYNTPSVEATNRVVRHYIEFGDRFLRVRFSDEKCEGRINSIHDSTNEALFVRIKRVLTNGIDIGDRHYEFLAFGNSQFREHGAYFFASLPHISGSNIRGWMGRFQGIRNIAKFAARLGQCFSTTRAVRSTPVQVINIPEIERNGFIFSDGVGRLSKFLAEMIRTEFCIDSTAANPPSAFQFRLGGRKGVLAISPENCRQQVHIRPSQHKFDANSSSLEIVRHSHYSMATLNRQLITILSALGVPDHAFLKLQNLMLAGLDSVLTNDQQAYMLLTKYVDPNESALWLASLVKHGFRSHEEPFVTSLLRLWCSWQRKYLKEKAKLVVDQGACLLGCLDETAVLKGFHWCKPSPHASEAECIDHLPEVFVQVSQPFTKSCVVVQGLCILARNPALHPGDIRVVRAVDVPSLHHLRDVVVLPQTGDRDVASMCAGGDLDGDEYVVIWDPNLLPKRWFEEPMDYTAPKTHELTRDVTVDDITSFFVNYIKHDHLPQIALAHLALADALDDGPYNQKCLRLANLHSAAVDYNKTGVPASFPSDLRPRRWPHFMERNCKTAERTYHSKKVLGQLYDAVDRVDFRPHYNAAFDKRILGRVSPVTCTYSEKATTLKNCYDTEVKRIMAHHRINTEFEVISAFALSHSNIRKDYTFHEELGRISVQLRERFHKDCVRIVGGESHESLAPLAIAMYKVTADEMTRFFSHTHRGDSLCSSDAPLISFPWVLYDTLCEVVCGKTDHAISPTNLQNPLTDLSLEEHPHGERYNGPTQTGKGPRRGWRQSIPNETAISHGMHDMSPLLTGYPPKSDRANDLQLVQNSTEAMFEAEFCLPIHKDVIEKPEAIHDSVAKLKLLSRN